MSADVVRLGVVHMEGPNNGVYALSVAGVTVILDTRDLADLACLAKLLLDRAELHR